MSLRLTTMHRSTRQTRQHARARCDRQLWALEGLEGRVFLSGNPTVNTVADTSDSASDPSSLDSPFHP